MTQVARPFRWIPVALIAILFLPAVTTAHADGEGAQTPPSDWIARVGDQYLSRRRLAATVVWRVRQELMELGSGPLTILRQIVEERVVDQEARRLGLHVTNAEVDAKYREIDTKVRRRTNAAKTLREVIVREQNSSVEEFRQVLRLQLLKEKVAGHQTYIGPLPVDEKSKIAQIEVVIGELLGRAKVAYGARTALQAEPSKLERGVIATVNGEPITLEEYGEELIARLATSRIKAVIRDECKALLTRRWALSVEAMDAVIARERERWDQWRTMTTQEVLTSVSYDDYVKMQYRLAVEQLKQDSYFRGLYGLVEAFRQEVAPEQIREEYEAKKSSVYGDAYLVTDIQVKFVPRNDLLGPSGGRTRREALKLANTVVRQAHAQEPFEDIARDVNQKRDPTFFARRLRIRNTDNERLLYEQAKLLDDGQVSHPFETLAEVHVLRREQRLEAPTYPQVEDMIRQGLALTKAHAWLEEQMTNPELVEVRWPPEERRPGAR